MQLFGFSQIINEKKILSFHILDFLIFCKKKEEYHPILKYRNLVQD